MVLTLGVASIEFARAFLLKGLIDDVGLPIAELQPTSSGWLGELPLLPGGADAPADAEAGQRLIPDDDVSVGRLDALDFLLRESDFRHAVPSLGSIPS